MKKQLSFSKYERKILPSFRNKINQAESTEDLKKFFSYSCRELLQQIFAAQDIKMQVDDIVFDPEAAPFFKVNDRLASSPVFGAVWQDSDMRSLLSHLAQTAQKRYVRLGKHLDKTEAKIRM